MNCLRISPGTARKSGAMVRKWAAQAAVSICGGSLYWTIAVIIVLCSSAAGPPGGGRLPGVGQRPHPAHSASRSQGAQPAVVDSAVQPPGEERGAALTAGPL